MDFEIVWLAGLFDGDGSICIRRSWPEQRVPSRATPSYQLVLGISNNDGEVLRLIKDALGLGSVQTVKSPLGNPFFSWTCVCQDAANLLRQISPHLKIKKKEARLAEDFLDLMRKTRPKVFQRVLLEDVAQRDAYYWVLKRAKHVRNTALQREGRKQ